MTVEPRGDHIVLFPESDYELDLIAGIVEAIALGGWIQVESPTISTRLEFDGDQSFATKRRSKQ